MRVLLFTGKGGVGKSTVASGTAALAAARGLRTLVVSTDAAHSLGDTFDTEVGAEPVQVSSHLWVQHVDAQRQFEESWSQVQSYLLDVMRSVGVDPLAAEELTVLPGAEEVLALLELHRQASSGEYDVVVVDCAPTAETLRLLALPEALTWYMDRVFPAQRRVTRALGPMLGRAVGVPMPKDPVFDAVERLHRELGEVRELLTGPDCTVRLVLTPERVVLAEARRSWTTLSLFGYRVDGVVANRVFDPTPEEASDGSRARAWLDGWVDAQQAVLEEADDSFAPLRVWRSTYRSSEPRGVQELSDTASALYGEDDPLAEGPGIDAVQVQVDADGGVLSLPLPLAARGETDLVRRAGDLVVTCGSYRRVLTLPTALGRMEVSGAKVEGGRLAVRFSRTDTDERTSGGER